MIDLIVPPGYVCVISCETFDHVPQRVSGILRVQYDGAEYYFDGVPARHAYGEISMMSIQRTFEHYECRRDVQVYTGEEFVPCQGPSGAVQCPECEHFGE